MAHPLHQGGGPLVPCWPPEQWRVPRHCVTWPSPTPTRPVISWPTKWRGAGDAAGSATAVPGGDFVELGSPHQRGVGADPADFELDGETFVVLRTSNSAGAAGPAQSGEAVKRLVPLLDPAYAQLAREYLSTFAGQVGPDLDCDRSDGAQLAERGRAGTEGGGDHLGGGADAARFQAQLRHAPFAGRQHPYRSACRRTWATGRSEAPKSIPRCWRSMRRPRRSGLLFGSE